MDEHPLWARDRVGNGEEILTYFVGFCVATNYDKLSVLATLDLRRGQLLRLELGIENGHPHSRMEIMRIMKISSRDLAKERAIALTRLAGAIDF
jgi:hypothetical protein